MLKIGFALVKNEKPFGKITTIYSDTPIDKFVNEMKNKFDVFSVIDISPAVKIIRIGHDTEVAVREVQVIDKDKVIDLIKRKI